MSLAAAYFLKEQMNVPRQNLGKLQETISKTAISIANEHPMAIVTFYNHVCYHLCIAHPSGNRGMYTYFAKDKKFPRDPLHCGWIFQSRDGGDTFNIKNSGVGLAIGASTEVFEDEADRCTKLKLAKLDTVDPDDNGFLWSIKVYGEDNYKLVNWQDYTSKLHIVDKRHSNHEPCLCKEGMCVSLEKLNP